MIDLSPPGWTREASAPPSPASLLSVSTPGLAPDSPAIDVIVIVILDSIQDLDPDHYYNDDPDDDDHHFDQPAFWQVDWDSVLDAALMELGLHASRRPDWFWYRRGRRD